MEMQDFTDLADDGDTWAIDDTHYYKLVIEHDPFASINDYDCYGRVEPVDTRRERATRPAGFDGSARKLWVGRSECVWWMPYREGRKVYDSREEVNAVRDLLEEGFKVVGLQLWETVTDSFGNDHDVEVLAHYLGGVDRFYPELLTELRNMCEDGIQ